MELNIRMLKDSDWNTLVEWWDTWPDWVNPPKDFLPDNGKGGFMVEKNNQPIVAGFLYTTNSKAALLEWIVSNPEYREKDRLKAIELLIKGAENVCKKQGIKYIFSIGRNKHLINTHKKLGYQVDDKPSHEITKKL
tara:strand:+ start:137 stop:544 length:408 start_codon:yes stop_codon:yes gene_type:complete